MLRSRRRFPWVSVSIFDPISTHIERNHQKLHTWPEVKAWVKYVLLKRPITGPVYLVVAEVNGCSCKAKWHRNVILRTVNKLHAEKAAHNRKLYYAVEKVLHIHYNPLREVLSGPLQMGHRTDEDPTFYVKEFPSPDEAATYMTNVNRVQRDSEANVEGILGAGAGGAQFGGGGGEETMSMQDVGGAYLIRHKTVKHVHEELSSREKLRRMAPTIVRKEDENN